LKVNPKDESPRAALGESYEDQRTRAWVLAASRLRRQRQGAIPILEALQARRPLDDDDQFLLAQLYQGHGDWAKADALLRLLTSRKDNALHLAFFANALVGRGTLDRAQAMPLSPGTGEFRSAAPWRERRWWIRSVAAGIPV
jgi:uncharacterized protein HemY